MLKSITLIFLVSQLLDIIITALFIKSDLVWEVNPLGFNIITISLKLVVISLVSVALEARNYNRMIWILPIISVSVVVWNITVILFEIL